MVVVEWVERIVGNGPAKSITRKAESPAVLGEPVFDGMNWRIPVHADAGRATVILFVNDAEIEVSLQQGQGEVVLDGSTPGVIYEVEVVGAPEVLPGVPAPGCRVVVEV